MNIAIIDSEINEAYYDFGKLKAKWEIDDSLRVVPGKTEDVSIKTHGTVCAAIIKKYAPHADIIGIKVLDDEENLGDCAKLLSAIRWCFTQQFPIVHMSLGSTCPSDFEPLRIATLNLVRNGTIVIAAYDNRNYFTVPADLSFVVGVKGSPVFQDDQYSMQLEDSCVIASGHHSLKTYWGTYETTEASNSYAAPLITALIHNIMQTDHIFTFQEILKRLSEGGLTKRRFNWQKAGNIIPDFISEAIVISTGLPYNLKTCFSFKIKKQIKEINDALPPNSELVIIPHYPNQYLNQSDEILKQKKPKSIIFAGNRSMGIVHQESLRCAYWDENNYDEFCKRIICSKQDISIPIIAISGDPVYIIGLLQQIKTCFEKDGYNPCLCATYPYSYLFGFFYLKQEYQNHLLRYISRKYQYDLILLGCFKYEARFLKADYQIDLSLYWTKDNQINQEESINQKNIAQQIKEKIIRKFQ